MTGDEYVRFQFKRQVRVFENNHVSYLHFINTEQILVPGNFQHLIEQAHLSWKPDFGIWPPRGIWNAFARIDAEECAEFSGIETWEGRVHNVSNGDYIRFDSVDFGTGSAECEMHASSGGIGGVCEFRIDSLNGALIGSVSIENSGGWDIPVTKLCTIANTSGVHALYLKFTGGQTDLFDIDWFQFSRKTSAVDDAIPMSSHVYQNYPNPFNPSTTILYDLATPSFASLRVYDVLGREVAVLAHEMKDAGHYCVIFQGADLTSGTYIATLTVTPLDGSQPFIKSMKLLLVK
jgi:hypothetical protein